MKHFLYALGVLFLLGACLKKKDENLVVENYTADWALQVINSEFTMADIIDRTDTNNLKVKIDGDDIILSYSESVKTDLPTGFYKIQNQVFPGEYVAPISIPAVTANGQAFNAPIQDYSTTLPSFPLDINNTTINDAELKEILVESGVFELVVRNTYLHPLTVNFPVPSATNNGQVLEFANIVVPAGAVIIQTQNLDDYTVNLKHPTTGALNSIDLKASISGTLINQPVNVGDKIAFTLTMKDVKFQHIIGKLGTFTIPSEKGENEISLFKELDGSTQFHIETYELKTTITTDFGIPMALKMENLNFLNEDDVTSTGVISGADDPINIPALSSVSQVGNTVTTTEKIFSTTTHPDLTKIFTVKPNKFEYDASLIINPTNDPSEDLFISKDSKVETLLEGDFYLHGYLRGFTHTDTIPDIDLSDGETDGKVKEATIRFIFENGMPLELGIDILFLDKDNNVVDQELNNIKIESASVDNNGYSIATTNKIVDLVLNADRMANISTKVNKIVLVSKLETTGAQVSKNVHIRPQDKMKIIIGVRVKGDVNLNDQ